MKLHELQVNSNNIYEIVKRTEQIITLARERHATMGNYTGLNSWYEIQESKTPATILALCMP